MTHDPIDDAPTPDGAPAYVTSPALIQEALSDSTFPLPLGRLITGAELLRLCERAHELELNMDPDVRREGTDTFIEQEWSGPVGVLSIQVEPEERYLLLPILRKRLDYRDDPPPHQYRCYVYRSDDDEQRQPSIMLDVPIPDYEAVGKAREPWL